MLLCHTRKYCIIHMHVIAHISYTPTSNMHKYIRPHSLTHSDAHTEYNAVHSHFLLRCSEQNEWERDTVAQLYLRIPFEKPLGEKQNTHNGQRPVQKMFHVPKRLRFISFTQWQKGASSPKDRLMWKTGTI